MAGELAGVSCRGDEPHVDLELVDPFGSCNCNRESAGYGPVPRKLLPPIGLSISYSLPFGVSGTGFAGIAFDGQGNIAPYFGGGLGAGIGAGGSGGVQLAGSDADSICDLQKSFGNASVGIGDGVSGTVDGF
jgi:hypothetical protein